MPDREKVINDLLEIRKDYEDMRCKVSVQIINDAITLLKEQENDIHYMSLIIDEYEKELNK